MPFSFLQAFNIHTYEHTHTISYVHYYEENVFLLAYITLLTYLCERIKLFNKKKNQIHEEDILWRSGREEKRSKRAEKVREWIRNKKERKRK